MASKATKKSEQIDEVALSGSKDLKLINIMIEEFSEFGPFLVTPQDRAMYMRKIKDYAVRASVRIKALFDDGADEDIATE